MTELSANGHKPMTVAEVRSHLKDLVKRYPEYADAILDVNDEYGKHFYATSVELANGPWLVVDELEFEKDEVQPDEKPCGKDRAHRRHGWTTDDGVRAECPGVRAHRFTMIGGNRRDAD